MLGSGVFSSPPESLVSKNFIVFITKFGPQLSDSNQVIMHNLKPIMGTDGREGEGEVDNSHHLLTPTKFWENSRKISREGIEILIP